MDYRNKTFDLDTWYRELAARAEEKRAAEQAEIKKKIEAEEKKAAEAQERFNRLLAGVGDQVRKDRLAAIEKEKNEAAEKARKEIDAKYGTRKNDDAWKTLLDGLRE